MEIEVFINDAWINPHPAADDFRIWSKTKGAVTNGIKAKLVIEIPDRKIELTESDFDKAVEKFAGPETLDRQILMVNKELLKEELFRVKP